MAQGVRLDLLSIHKQSEEVKLSAKLTRHQRFVRKYRDNEVDHEEEKKLHVASTRERGPYGMNIRKAAYRAYFGSRGSHPVLQKYCFNSADSK